MDPLTRNQGVQRPRPTAGVRGQTYHSAQARSTAYANRSAMAPSASRPAQPIAQATNPGQSAYASAPAREITPTLDPIENFEPITPTSNKPKKSGGKIIGVIVAIIFAIAMFGCGILVGQNWDNIFKQTKEEKPVETSKTNSRDLSATEIKTLSDKVSYLMMADADTESFKMSYYRFLPSVVNNTLTDADKLEIAVYSLRSEYLNGENGSQTIAASRVEARYKELFGRELTFVEAVYCPGYTLSEDKQTYNIGSGCGGTTDNMDLLYKQNYYFENDYAYVDIVVGSVFTAAGEDTSKNTIYNDYYTSTKKNTYKTIADFASLEEFNNFTISSDNADSFTHYSLKFAEDENGNFYFVSASLVENNNAPTSASEPPADMPEEKPEDLPEPPADGEKPADAPDEQPAEQSYTGEGEDIISYKTDPDAPACPRNNPAALCRD